MINDYYSINTNRKNLTNGINPHIEVGVNIPIFKFRPGNSYMSLIFDYYREFLRNKGMIDLSGSKLTGGIAVAW